MFETVLGVKDHLPSAHTQSLLMWLVYKLKVKIHFVFCLHKKLAFH